MLMGVYTGGTPNLTAIGLSLGVDSETLIVVNGAEMLFGACWLFLLLTIAKPLIGKVLRSGHKDTGLVAYNLDEKIYLKSIPVCFGLALLIAGASLGISYLFFDPNKPVFFAVAFLLVTSLGIAGSAISAVRKVQGSFGLGNYLLLVFCVTIGSQADVGKIFGVSPAILGIVAFVMCATILLHLLLCLVFRIDVETFIISSTAGIFGPPFIAPVARAIRHPYLIPVGLALGVLGLAVGNYCGLAISNLLERL
jgi:uncharacterized membrane protein